MMRYFWKAFFILTFLGCLTNYSVAEDKSKDLKRENILQVFKKAIELKKGYKNSRNHEERRRQLKILEEYHEKVLDPAIVDCVKLLSFSNDTELALNLFKFILSFEDFADDIMYGSLAEIFLNNPDLVVNTFINFNEKEKEFLYLQLYWGWKNIVAEKNLQEEKMTNHLEKLKRFNPGVEIPKKEEREYLRRIKKHYHLNKKP